jgi:uncharacterized protein YwqG
MINPLSLDELRAAVRRPASVARVVTGRVEPDAFRSRLGAVSVARIDEPWPEFDGRPMAGLAQVNLSEVPYVPDGLRGLAFLTLYISEDGYGLMIPDGHPNGEGWLLRTYPSLEGLVEVRSPREPAGWLRPRDLRWESVEDMPASEDLEDLVGVADYRQVEALLAGQEVQDVIGRPADGTKLGGWPTLIQSEINWAPLNQHPAKPSYCFQIDSEEKVGLNLWDGGVIHIGRGEQDGRAVWVAETQFL